MKPEASARPWPQALIIGVACFVMVFTVLPVVMLPYVMIDTGGGDTRKLDRLIDWILQ